MVPNLTKLAGSLSLAIFLTCSTAEDFVIPGSWKGTISQSVDQINSTLQGALQVLTPLINKSTSQITRANGIASADFGGSEEPVLIRTLATSDLAAGTSENHVFLINLPNFERAIGSLLVPTLQGLAWYNGYRTYKDPQFLDKAVDAWNTASAHAVSEMQAQTQSHPDLPDQNINETCHGSTVAGAFISGSPRILPDTVGAFLGLTAYLLAESSTNDTYSRFASLSANFIRNHLYNNDTGLLNAFSITDCSFDSSYSITTSVVGYAIEGLSVWANVTEPGEDWRSFIDQLVASSIKSRSWTNIAGVIIEGSSNNFTPGQNFIIGGKGIFISVLQEAWRRINASSPAANLISAFINVQYNALVTTAAHGNSYSHTWDASESSATFVFDAWAQTAAVSVFNAALDLTTHNATSINVTTSANGTSSSRAQNAGAIAGGVIGGVFGVAILAGLTFYILRRHRRLQQSDMGDIPVDSRLVHSSLRLEPFLSEQPTSGSSLHQILIALPGGGTGTKFARMRAESREMNGSYRNDGKSASTQNAARSIESRSDSAPSSSQLTDHLVGVIVDRVRRELEEAPPMYEHRGYQ